MTLLNILKNATLLSSFVFSSTLFLPSSTFAQTRTLTYMTSATYGGVHRCGSREANKREARNAAVRKVNSLNNKNAGEFQYRLRSYAPVNPRTRRWKEKDRFGFVKGRKCQTTMDVKVVVQRREVNW